MSFKNAKKNRFSSFYGMILRKRKKFITFQKDNFRTCFVLSNINFQNKDFYKKSKHKFSYFLKNQFLNRLFVKKQNFNQINYKILTKVAVFLLQHSLQSVWSKEIVQLQKK